MSEIITGNWRAVVTDNMDPTKSGRVKIDIDSLRLRNMWAEPAIQIGGSSIHGSYVIPRVGDKVFVFFDGGSIHHPIYFAASPSQNDIPVAFNGGTDPLINTRNSNVITTPKFTEPTTNTTVEYPYGQGIKFPGGTLIIVDESGGETKLGVYHPSNSYNEIQGDGTHIARVSKDDYEIILGDKFMYVGGSIAAIVAQNFGIQVGGNYEEEIIGNQTVKVGGSMTEQVAGNSIEQIGGNKQFTVIGNFSIQTAQAFQLIAQAIQLTASSAITLIAPVLTLQGIVRLGPVGSLPVHVFGSSYCPYIGSLVTGGSTTVFGSP